MDSAQDKYKKWGVALIVFLLILIPAEIAFIKSKIVDKPQAAIINKQVSEIKQEHPSVYFIDLEYDPNTENAVKKFSGYSNEDLTFLDREATNSAQTFTFRVEAVSNNQILLNGWDSLYKTVITTPDGKYSFRISVPYVSGETINIYKADSKKIFEEKVI